MNFRWLIGGGLIAGLILAAPACGSSADDGGATSPGAGVTNGPDGSLADVTPNPQDGGSGTPDVALLPSACNDGKLDPGETCDPLAACPTECPPLNCQLRTLDNGGTCTAVCDDTAVQTTCLNGDGCCPAGCNATDDNDCTAVCGNGIIEEGETCDGNCPQSCENVGCENYTLATNLLGNPCTARCVDAKTQIKTCGTMADQCCPSGCPLDPDCGLNVCGNGTVDKGETCDPGNNSPTKCPTMCAAPDGCNIQTLHNAGTCTATCASSMTKTCANGDGCCPAGCNATNDDDCAAVCGNGVVEPGEDCDGNCPSSCPQQGCQEYTLDNKGACNITCKKSELQTGCVNGDQCCPSACSPSNDNDCGTTKKPVCGDTVVEPPETCDGDCPTCATPAQCFQNTGSPATCDVVCNLPIETCAPTARDGCCPYAKTNGSGNATCGSAADPDCTGKSWLVVSFGTTTVAAGHCATFVISGVTNGGSYDFTTCAGADAPTKGTGNPRITDATQAKGTVVESDGAQTVPNLTGPILVTTYPIANDDCTDPSSLPLLAGYSCKNQGGAVTMACASADSGGFTSSSANPITVQVCAAATDTTFPFTVFYNATTAPTVALQ